MTGNVMQQEITDNYAIYNGDCVEVASGIPDNSLGMSVFSPPFLSLYTFSNNERDLGNCRTDKDFFDQFSFLIKELYRATMPGRIAAIHCMNLPTSKNRDGHIGVKDFRGDIIRAFEAVGWHYSAEVTIWKCPVVAMQRTKSIRLLNKQKNKDSTISGMGLPDYVIFMRKPGDNIEPVSHTNEDFPIDLWQKIASPVWMDIKQSDTLQYKSAREHKDEKHITPLQLEVIRRCLLMYSNPGDTIYSPFAGIGSEGYVALEMGRKFIGSELKGSYFDQQRKNLKNATDQQKTIFDQEFFG